MDRLSLLAEQPWPRLIVDRPDVPPTFYAKDSIMPRTPEERIAADVALRALYEEVQGREGKPPEWFGIGTEPAN